LIDASDGRAAIRTVEAEKPDLMILDLNLPDMTGLDVCQAIRGRDDERVKSTPILMLTAMSGAEDTRAGFDAGASDFLTKPFTPAHLRSRVASWLLRTPRA
jgi:DNA-binding response OmpR family regulator